MVRQFLAREHQLGNRARPEARSADQRQDQILPDQELLVVPSKLNSSIGDGRRGPVIESGRIGRYLLRAVDDVRKAVIVRSGFRLNFVVISWWQDAGNWEEHWGKKHAIVI